MHAVSTTVTSTPGVMLTRAGQAGCSLRWDAVQHCWRWPDPVGHQLYAWPAPAAMPIGVRMLESARVMVHCRSGRVLLGQGKRLGVAALPLPGQGHRTLQAQVLLTIDAAEPRTSISDGCADRHGNLVFGTANTAPDRRPIGSFYQYSQRHGLRRLALPAVATAAGMAVSPDGATLYFADAAGGALMQCRYDADQARVSAVETFAQPLAREPGAAVVDSGGALWSVQGGVLVQYGADGEPRLQLTLGHEAAAGAAFGGAGLAQLLVLGAQGGLYGLPPALAADLAPGLTDTLFDDGGSASTAERLAWRD